MKKVAILTCSNATQDLGCSSSKCLKAVYRNEGECKRYEDQGGAELAGIINCAGCPTIAGPEKILGRIRSLSALGVDAIHLSTCMMAFCPYKNKYFKLLEERYPEIEIIKGTHDLPEGGQEMVVGWAKHHLSSQPNPTADLLEMENSEKEIA